MSEKKYSSKLEKEYYSAHWPKEPISFEHLIPYITCWLDPKIFNAKRVLDIGAGECAYTRLILENFNPKEIVASDIFIERMMPTIKHNKNKKLKFIQSDVFNLPFVENSFDVVFGSLVLSQLRELDKIGYQLAKVLKQNGLFIGIEPNPFNPIHLYRQLKGSHSKNLFLLMPKHFKTFEKLGFEIKVSFFHGRIPWLKGKLLASLMGITGKIKK